MLKLKAVESVPSHDIYSIGFEETENSLEGHKNIPMGHWYTEEIFLEDKMSYFPSFIIVGYI